MVANCFVLVGSYIFVRMPRCFDDVIVKFSLVIRLIIVRDRGIGGLCFAPPSSSRILLVSESVIPSCGSVRPFRVSVKENPFIHIHYDCFAKISYLPSCS